MEHFRGSKYVALMEPFKVLDRTFSSKNVCVIYSGTFAKYFK